MTSEELREHLNLTPMQAEVSLLAAQGLSNTEIAHELYMTPDRVIAHLHDSKGRLGVRNRIELAVSVARVVWEEEQR